MVGTDRGVLLSRDGHQEVSQVAQQLRSFCVEEPVKSPLIFGGECAAFLVLFLQIALRNCCIA